MHKAFASKAKGQRKLLECLKNYFWSYEKILYHASNRGTATARWELNYDRQSNIRRKSIRRLALWWRTIRLRWWLIRAAKCIINYHTHSTINHLCVWQGWLVWFNTNREMLHRRLNQVTAILRGSVRNSAFIVRLLCVNSAYDMREVRKSDYIGMELLPEICKCQ